MNLPQISIAEEIDPCECGYLHCPPFEEPVCLGKVCVCMMSGDIKGPAH